MSPFSTTLITESERVDSKLNAVIFGILGRQEACDFNESIFFISNKQAVKELNIATLSVGLSSPSGVWGKAPVDKRLGGY